MSLLTKPNRDDSTEPQVSTQPRPPESRRPNHSLPEPIKYLISALLLAIGIGIVVVMSMFRESNAKVESDALIPLVETSPVGNFQGHLDMVMSGTAVPYREIEVRAMVAGRIANKFPECEAGTFVTKGTPLIQIDPVDYDLEIKMAKAEILQAERTMMENDQDIRGAYESLEIAKNELDLQKNEFRRRQRLKNSLSPTEMDAAKRSLLNSESQVTTRRNTYNSMMARKESLKASMELNQTRLEGAEMNRKRTIVAAQVDGVIVRESVEEESFVGVSNMLYVIEDTSRSEVVCNLTPGELAWLQQHAAEDVSSSSHRGGAYDLPRVAVDIYEQSNPSLVWSGVLERYDGIGRNLTTKSIPCRIVVEDPIAETDDDVSRALVRGMFVKCRILLSAARGLELAEIPLIAIRPGDYVWVVRDKKLTRIDVEVVDRTPISADPNNKMVAVKITNGLRLGDEVVISPLPQPIEGGSVLLKDDNDTAELTTESQDDQTSELSNRTEEPDDNDAHERSEP